MSFTDPGYMAEVLQGVLEGVSAALTAAERPVERVARFPGPPVWDCEQLVVWPRTRIGGAGTATSSDILNCAFKQVLDINLLLTRCIVTFENDDLPSAATVDSDGLAFATDMWVVQRAISAGAKDGTLSLNACQEVRVNAITPLPPQGGFSGMSTTIEVTL